MNENIKIMTLNIGNPSEKRVKNQIRWIESREEDVFILTETKNSVGCNYLEMYFSSYINDLFHLSLNSNYYISFPKSSTNDLGVMCLSKFPIENAHSFFSQQSRFYSRLLHTEIQIASHKLNVTGVYVPSRDISIEKIERKKGFLDELTKFVSESHGIPAIICGDFNILDRNHIPKYKNFMNWEYEFYDKLIDHGYIDAYRFCHPNKHEYSWVGRTNDGYRYDYCFISREITDMIVDCYFVHDTRELGLTDHSAVVLELNINKC